MKGLDRLRDLWISAARELIADFLEATPERELGGILSRAGDLLGALSDKLDDFADAPLSGPERDLDAIEEHLLAARRIPRCVLAFASELERSDEDRAWSEVSDRARTLRLALRGLQHAWLLQEIGVDLVPTLPDPPLPALARLGRAARLDQLGSLLAPQSGEGAPPDEESDEEDGLV